MLYLVEKGEPAPASFILSPVIRSDAVAARGRLLGGEEGGQRRVVGFAGAIFVWTARAHLGCPSVGCPPGCPSSGVLI